MSPRKGARPPSDIYDLITQLRDAPVGPMPPEEEWEHMISRISSPGRTEEVSKKVYWYFLEVLTPKYMDGFNFCFAEGMEPLRLFWDRGDRYFCRQLTWDETEAFCRLANMPQNYWDYWW